MGLTKEQSCMEQQLIMHQCAQAQLNAADAVYIDASTVPYALFTGHDARVAIVMQCHASQLLVACMQEPVIPHSLRGHRPKAASAGSRIGTAATANSVGPSDPAKS